MKKIKNKIYILIFILISLIITIATYSLSATGVQVDGKEKMETTADLASFAEKDAKMFITTTYKDFLNKTVEPGGGSKYGRDSDINFSTSGCYYHNQSNSKGSDKIVGVVDIDGTDMKINGEKVELSEKEEVLVSKMAYAIWNAKKFGDHQYNNKQKNVIKDLWFNKGFLELVKKHSNDSLKSFWTARPNGIADAMINESKEEIKKAEENAYLKLQRVDKDNQKITKASDGNQYLGPFKVNYSGYDKVNNFVLTINGKEYKIQKYYTKKLGEYTECSDSRVQKKKNFYIKLEENIDLTKEYEWKLVLKTGEKKTYKGRILLISNPLADGQNLLVWSGQEDKTIDSVEWIGKVIGIPPPTEEKAELKIIKVDDRDNEHALKGVGFIFSTTIKMWDWDYSETVYRSCDCEKINIGDEIHQVWIRPHSDHNWTRNYYKQNEHTMYLGENGQWGYTPHTFYTNDEGIISFSGIKLPDPTYATNRFYDGDSARLPQEYVDNNIIAKEVENPNSGYEENIGTSYEVIRNSDEDQIIENHRGTADISGYVWIDGHDGKATVRNDLFDTGEEPGFNGIPVYLKHSKTGEILERTTTAELGLYSEIDGGEYQFKDIKLDEAENGNYYIEFEYNGLIYQAVTASTNVKNGSKAEDTYLRGVLDNKFWTVDGNGSQTLKTKDSTVTVDYSNTNNYISTMTGSSGTNVTASTAEAYYNIFDNLDAETGEIRYVNFGVYEKPQADYALTKDLYNVRVEINGFSHIYRYAQTRYTQDGNVDENSSWNVGVKFQKNNGTYNRAIYDSDRYNSNNTSNELQVYVTYKIALKNESSYLGRINSIVDYFDKRFELEGVGNSIDEKDIVSGGISYSNREEYNNKYGKYVFDVNSILNAGETKFVYIQFKLNRDAVDLIITDSELLNNVAEINSYTTFKNGDIDAPISVVDKDSVPGNAIPGRPETYEDDTDAARSLKLELNAPRAITGTVFEDNTGKETGKVYTGEERRGNGIFDNNDKRLEGIKVELRQVVGNSISKEPAQIYNSESKKWEAASTTTDNNGNFTFKGYQPGNYVVVYIWGNEEYKVQYYKGTIYKKGREQNDLYWYRGSKYGNDIISAEDRYTDALDNSDIRKNIDDEMKNITNNTLVDEIDKAYNGGSEYIKHTTMESITPTMEFSVEYKTTMTDPNVDGVKFTVNNVDFGIVERAKQKLELEKRVTGFKVILANGQVLVDAKVDKDGNVTGSMPYTKYLKPTAKDIGTLKPNGKVVYNKTDDGKILIEMDNELIEGATIETSYEIVVRNVGEVDYISQEYYYYGIVPKPEKDSILKVSIAELIDYVDGRLAIKNNENGTWMEINDKLKEYLDKVNASQKDDDSYINSTRTYLTEILKKPIDPIYENERKVQLYASKLLTSTEDNAFNNQAEITTVKKNDGFNGGTPVIVTYDYTNPNDPKFHFDEDNSEEINIIPSTGEDRGYVLPTVIGITSLLIIGLGIFGIKKFVIDIK